MFSWFRAELYPTTCLLRLFSLASMSRVGKEMSVNICHTFGNTAYRKVNAKCTYATSEMNASGKERHFLPIYVAFLV